jgi:signal transduction histidine kinase
MLSGTVNNVLSMHSGGNPLLVPVDLAACVESGVEFVRPIGDQAGVTLSFAGKDGKLAIQGNENVLRQIVLNLICNAIRHTPAGGKIEISTRKTTRQGTIRALLKITDTGCGIPPNLIERVFEPGFSASGDTPGLGLAVCKRLAIQLGGEIRVSSRVNRGSTFQLEFPTI